MYKRREPALSYGLPLLAAQVPLLDLEGIKDDDVADPGLRAELEIAGGRHGGAGPFGGLGEVDENRLLVAHGDAHEAARRRDDGRFRDGDLYPLRGGGLAAAGEAEGQGGENDGGKDLLHGRNSCAAG